MIEELIRVDGAELWSVTTGEGPVPVVMCHGGPGLSDNLAPLAAMVEDLCLVHRYDQRGGGRSSGDGPFTVSQFIEDLERLREHWGHETWIVVGHSWGGWLALLYATRYAARTTGLIAIGMPPPMSSGWREGYERELEARIPEEERGFYLDVARRRGDGEVIPSDVERRWRLLKWRTDFEDPAVAPEFSEEFPFPVSGEVNRDLNAEMTAWDATGTLIAELGPPSGPSLFLHGLATPDRLPTGWFRLFLAEDS